MLRFIPIALVIVSCSVNQPQRIAGQSNKHQFVGTWKLDSMLVNGQYKPLMAEAFIYFQKNGRYAGYSTNYLQQYEISSIGEWKFTDDTLWIMGGEDANAFTYQWVGEGRLKLSTTGRGPSAEKKDSYFTNVIGDEETIEAEIDYFEERDIPSWTVHD